MIKVVYTTTRRPRTDNSADVLTKYLPHDVYLRHTTKLMGHPLVMDGSGVAEGGVDG